MRFAVIQAFGISLAITILLSLYLAGTITRPVRRLAEAAARVRTVRGEKPLIPDFTQRRDEIGPARMRRIDQRRCPIPFGGIRIGATRKQGPGGGNVSCLYGIYERAIGRGRRDDGKREEGGGEPGFHVRPP